MENSGIIQPIPTVITWPKAKNHDGQDTQTEEQDIGTLKALNPPYCAQPESLCLSVGLSGLLLVYHNGAQGQQQ